MGMSPQHLNLRVWMMMQVSRVKHVNQFLTPRLRHNINRNTWWGRHINNGGLENNDTWRRPVWWRRRKWWRTRPR